MLDGAVGDHHITDIQIRIQSAADPGEDDHGASEPFGQQGGHHGDVDLAHACRGENRGVAVEFAGGELDTGDAMGRSHRHRTQEVRMLLGQGADQSDMRRGSTDQDDLRRHRQSSEAGGLNRSP